MPMTSKEKNEAYRRRRYEAGYKQMRVWVPRDSEGKTVKLEREMFIKHLEALTVGWSKTKLSKLFSDILKTVKEKVKEEEQK